MSACLQEGGALSFQPNLTAAASGSISLAFYDRRLSCPAAGSAEAAGAGLALDQVNSQYGGSLPPYGAENYCVNSSVQLYSSQLRPLGNNVRISQHTWDPSSTPLILPGSAPQGASSAITSATT